MMTIMSGTQNSVKVVKAILKKEMFSGSTIWPLVIGQPPWWFNKVDCCGDAMWEKWGILNFKENIISRYTNISLS